MIRHGAPQAPGKLGDRLEPLAVQTYLAELDEWIRARRAELDELDEAALASDRRAELTGDLTLSMAVWKAVSDRYSLLWATWDGGRVGITERERLSVLIWGRLDASLDSSALAHAGTGGALGVSLPEATRLSDALASQLRIRLSLDPAADEFARRVRDLRAQLERLRDQAALEPTGGRATVLRQVDALAARTDNLVARMERGGDIGGLIGPLENDAARLERDLIVGGSRRRELAVTMREVQEHRDALDARGEALATLAKQAFETVDPCPNYAVPEVDALGPVPTTAAELAAYNSRLDRVAKAMDMAQEAYAVALAGRSDLLARMDAAEVRASALGLTQRADVSGALGDVRRILDRRPTPVPVAAAAAALAEAWIAWWASDGGRRVAEGRGQMAGRSGS